MSKLGKILLILLVGLSFGFSSWVPTSNTNQTTPSTTRILSSNQFETVLEINVPGVEVNYETVDGTEYAVISLPGEAGTTTDIGFPQLPKICRTLGIPDNARVTISVVDSDYKTLTNITVYPFQTPTTDNAENPPFVINRNVYERDGFSPTNNATVALQAQWRQLYLANIEVTPFSYNPKTKELRVFNYLKVVISYTNGRRNRKTIEPWLARIYKKSIANYDILASSGLFDVRYLDNPGVRYLVLSHPDLTPAIESLVAWYNKRGIETKVISKVWSGYNEMKDSIRAEYNRSTPPVLRWALLVGDVDRMPNGVWGTTSISDYWFGNLEPATPDLYAEVGIGRLSCTDASDLSNQVRKVLKYSKDPPMDGWLDKSALIAHKELYPSKYSACKRGIYNKPYAYYRFTMDTIFGQFVGNSAVTAAINEGRNVVNYRGHGDETIWWQWGTPAEDWSNTNVYALNNGDKTPIVFNICCLNHVITTATCLGEAWLRKYPGGAVASLGASIASYTIPNHGFDSSLYRGLCDTVDLVIPGVRTYYAPVWDLGWLLNLGNAYFAYAHGSYGADNARAYFWLGDPAMEVWTGTPPTPDVTYPPTVPLGPYDLTVTVSASGSPVEGALVCVQKDGEFYVFGYTDAFGQVTLSINANSVGEFDVTVSAHTILPFEGTCLARVTGQPYVVHLRHVIDDLAGGNGDGIVNPGETINMPIWIKNQGDSTGHDITGYLIINDPNITITDSVKSFGDVLAHDSAFTGGFGYHFTVSSACTNGYTIRFNLACKDMYDTIWNSNIFIVVGAPVISYVDKVVDDAGQILPNGKLDPGETAQLIVILSNQGRGNAYNVACILRSGDSRLTIDDSVGTFGTILVDSLGNNNADRFTVTASALIPPETPIPCTLYITAGSGYSTIKTFSLPVGAITEVDPIPDGPREPPLYYAYDNVDTYYEEHPTYEWVEINTLGTRLTPIADDQTFQITLPAAFGPWKFYNQRFTQLSICSNGWVAPGYQTSNSWTNRRLPDPNSANPNGMVCANWDDLYPSNTGTGGVYYYHDSTNHRFIIEYDSIPYISSTVREKFEIIIYDTIMAAADGHNEIIVNYMTNNRWNSSTAGIEDPTNLIAINCLYNDTLHRGCAAWTPFKVIKYTTDPPFVPISEEPNQTILTDLTVPLRTYPNPFHGIMRVQFTVKQDGPVSLSIHDISGRLVRSLVSSNLKPGNYSFYWDGKDTFGRKVANGIYFYQFKTTNEKLVTKSVLMR